MDHYTFQVGRRRGARERCWEAALPAALLSDGGRGVISPLPPLREDARWQGELRRIRGGWQLQGGCRFWLRRECSRCLQPFWWSLSLVVEREFLTADLEEGEDPLISATGEVDLIDLLREEVWLSWRQFVVCSDGCPGMAVRAAPPESERPDAHPFAALAQLQLNGKD